MAAHLWWLVQKDILTEWRGRQIGPAMLLLGGAVGFVFAMQVNSSPESLPALISSQYWLTVFLGGILALDGTFVSERDVGGFHGLRLYPIPPHTLFLAKFITNALFLGLLQITLALLFAALVGVRCFQHPGRLFLLGFLGNLAVASLGTLLAAVACGLQKGRGLLATLLLPLEIPVVIAAAEATRLLLLGGAGDVWWRWMQLLAAFAIVFTTAGAALFEFVIED